MAHADHAGLAGHLGGPDVGGENLDRSKAVFDVLVEGFQRVGGDFAQKHQMVGVVGVGVAPPVVGPFLDSGGDVDAGVLDGEVHEGGGAAEEGGAADLLGGSGTQVAWPHDGGGDVGVGFDAAGDDDLASGVDNPSHLFGEGVGGGDGDDFIALDGNIPIADAPGGYHLSVADNQVQHF